MGKQSQLLLQPTEVEFGLQVGVEFDKKATRAEEREQDMAKISEMIEAGVKEEVQAVLKRVEERLSEQEKITKGLSGQISQVLSNFEALKGEVKASAEFPAIPCSHGGAVGKSVSGVGTVSVLDRALGHSGYVLKFGGGGRGLREESDEVLTEVEFLTYVAELVGL